MNNMTNIFKENKTQIVSMVLNPMSKRRQLRLILRNAIYQIVTHANLIGLQIKITCHNLLHLHEFPLITFSSALHLINL